MKKIVLLIFISLFGLQSYGQEPDPNLFQTWYLTSYFYDFGEEYSVIDINPEITPTLIINENLEFSGEGACNIFSGNFVANEFNIIFENPIFTDTTCDYQSHIDFEEQYFGYYNIEGNPYEYTITEGEFSEQILRLDAPLFFGMIFSNQVLSTPNNLLSKTKIYPNPVSETLFISSENNDIETFSVYSITGEIILEKKNTTNSIDVSSLSKGLYFIEIVSSKGKTIQKFIKK